MNWRWKYLTGTAIALTLVGGLAAIQGDRSVPDELQTLPNVSAATRFTDAQGNSRLPSVAERAELAAAFQKDLADLTKNRKLPKGSKRESNGSVSAVVGTEGLRFLVADVDENGVTSFEHSTMDENGHIEPASTNELPEM
jgi:hypothetical protein